MFFKHGRLDSRNPNCFENIPNPKNIKSDPIAQNIVSLYFLSTSALRYLTHKRTKPTGL